jgi:hypothetical protein
MHNLESEGEAEMLARMADSEMKTALLEAYVKAIRSKGPISRKTPLFLEASYEKNTKSYMKFNREPKPQTLTIADLASSFFELKK